MKTLISILAALALAGFQTRAAKPVIAPEAEAVLTKAATFYKALKSARAEITITIAQSMQGEPASQTIIKQNLAIQRPAKIATRVTESPEGTMHFSSDGKHVWTAIDTLRQYTVADAPASLQALLDTEGPGPESLSQLGHLHSLLHDDPQKVLLDGLTSLTQVGTEKLGEVEIIKLRGADSEMDWEAWYEAGEQPLLRKFTFSPIRAMLAELPEEARAELKNAKLDITIDCTAWQLDTPIDPAHFTYQPPKDFNKVADFMGNEDDESPAMALVGQPAPEFMLPMLGGGELKLGDHRGKSILILDFWASWCGPCVAALPKLAELAAQYKDRDVQLYAINQQESAEAIQKFLASKKLQITVPLDAKGDAAKLYRVTGIPQTVLIGKDGNIAAIYIGFGPETKADLAAKIEELLKK